MSLPLAIVAAIADNGVLGRANKLIWRLKSDLRRFRALTMGKPLLMGRRTFTSIGKPLPGRETIVLTRDRGFSAEGVHVAHSLDEAVGVGEELAARMDADRLMVVGGAAVYEETLPIAKILHLTLVHAAPDGDVSFPAWDRSAFREVFRKEHQSGGDDEHGFTFVDYERRARPNRARRSNR